MSASASKGERRRQNQSHWCALRAAWREPVDWPGGVRPKGDMIPAWASGQNVRTLPVIPREKAQAADPRGRTYRCTGEGRTAP